MTAATRPRRPSALLLAGNGEGDDHGDADERDQHEERRHPAHQKLGLAPVAFRPLFELTKVLTEQPPLSPPAGEGQTLSQALSERRRAATWAIE